MAVPPTIRRPASPPPDAVPSPALKRGASGPNTASIELSRCLSTASSASHGSATTDGSSRLSLGFVGRDAGDSRDSLGSDASSSAFSRQSSASYTLAPPLSPSSRPSGNRLSTGSTVTVASTATTATGMTAAQAHVAAAVAASAKRRGYMRPQGTDFAASARSRESVLSLGSIAHLQHYFARTGLLDIKGQLERRRRGKARTLDLSLLDPAAMAMAGAGSLPPRAQSMLVSFDADSSYASMGSSPELSAAGAGAAYSDAHDLLVESPVHDTVDDDWYDGADLDGADPSVMLPPTVSTYMHREKPLPKPPSQAELKADLKSSLDSASAALAEVRTSLASAAASGSNRPATPSSPASPAYAAGADASPGPRVAVTSWYEIQGMHILDVMTLAIRAAKVYYTSHENPDRLDAIKAEREVRSELLGVMDVLKRMATRSFSGGLRADEVAALDAWLASLYAMLDTEDALVAAERAEQASWSWLHDTDWPADAAADPVRAYAREHAFLQSILCAGPAGDDKKTIDTSLPEWVPMDRIGGSVDDTTSDGAGATDGAAGDGAGAGTGAPTAFLQHMQNGVCLVQLHNCAVRKSRRRFGAIPSFHSDTLKPYRAADNLRYWVKAAELRWEVLLKIDALGIVCNSRSDVWPAFEDAIYQWCRKVREEITAEVV